ncbi:MAG: LamB/YcsF family protein, partial [Acidobacteria bacterium]
MSPIDLNSDLGEGAGGPGSRIDDDLLGVVTSANVACGFHAGDASTMRGVTAHAVRSGVAVGAHVAYDDKETFGRRFLDLDPAVLADQVTYQVAALDAFARLAGARVTYVKPHGGLYNAIVTHQAQA